MANITYPPFLTTKKLPFSINPVDEQGNVVPGSYSWSTSDSTIATVDPAPDTLSAFLIPVAPGAVTLTVSGGGLTDTADGTITASLVALNLTFGTPEDK